MNLSGLSATYPGYAAAEDQTAKTQANQYAAREAAIKLLGAHVLGAALTGQQGPQAPAPGQPSVPNAPAPPTAIPPQGAPAVPQGGPPAAPQPPSAAGGGAPEISLPALTARILQTAPGVRNHPEILIAALERAAPMLDRQGKEDLAEERKKFTEQRIEIARQRMEEATRWHNLVSEDKARRESGVQTRTDTRQESAQDRFNRLHPNAPAVGVPSPDSPPAATPGPFTPPAAPAGPSASAAPSVPPVTALKPNIVTTFANGQKWTLGADGQPKQVQ